ncbi:three-Cys-motif partner protein TcmP [Microcoleus sp. Z1_B5]|uniref:three-Cys-motif partner protein TcmP n=1 Tax=Microcoleus sp. Z1_B5 TaxID=3055430 RepID=UPI002FD16864
MADSSFFDELRDNSLVKAEIVAQYFWAWAKVIIKTAKKGSNKIAYIDLFSGPGRYQDGSKSTPLLILERAIADPDMSQMLVTLFNDKNSNHTQSLKQAIASIPDIGRLRHEPIVLNKEVGEEIFQAIQQINNNVPTLFFVDPWGYKGLSLKLIRSLIKGWGCDCIFFFNYNKINPGLNNPKVKEHMNSLFGQERVNVLQPELKLMSPEQRELTIVNAICKALEEVGGSHVQDFCFKNAKANRTSHYLIFVSKSRIGHSIIKDIMGRKSSIFDQGVPSFEYNPAPAIQLSLFDIKPPDELENMLLDEFAGKTLTMLEVYNQHHVGKRYIKKNYKQALLKLEAEGKIITNPSKRTENTFGDSVEITFLPK